MRLACLLAASALLAASEPTPLGQGPILFVQRATATTGARLVHAPAGRGEQVLLEDARKAVDPGFTSFLFRNPFEAFGVSPDGEWVLVGSFAKASDFSLRNSGFVIPGWDPFGLSDGFKPKPFESFQVWSKATGKTTTLWTADALETAWEAQKAGISDATLKNIPLRKVLDSGVPMLCFHLEGPRFLWVAGAVSLVVDVQAKTFQPVLTGQGKGKVSAWQTRNGAVRIQYDNALMEVSKAGSVERIAAFPLSKSGTKILLRPGMLLDWPESPSQPLILRMIGKDQVYFQGIGGGDPASTFVTHDGERILISRDEVLKAYGLDGRERWSLKTPMKEVAYFTQEGGTLGLLGLKAGFMSLKVQVVKVDLASGKILEAKEVQPEMTPEGPRAMPDLLDRAGLVPTPEGTVVWIPSRGAAGESPSPQWGAAKTDALKATDGTLFILGTDFILRPVWSCPLADNLMIHQGGHTIPFATWTNSGVRLKSEFPVFAEVPGASKLPFHQELHGSIGASQSSPFLGLQSFPSEDLQDWARDLIRSQRTAPGPVAPQ